jgi:uncharacterized 2Fe-2S/4Fe-4S cluster protein (DUF4445 family)
MNIVKTEKSSSGENLLSHLRSKGYKLPSPCGGKGVCGKCKVRVIEGGETLRMPYPGVRGITLAEWEQGWRLACKTAMHEELQVEVPDPASAEANILTSGSYEVTLQPCIQKRYLELTKPSIEDQSSDVDRLEKALGPIRIDDLKLVQRLSDILSANDYKVTAVIQNDELIAVEGGDTTGLLFGIAIDIGSTTVAGVLIDLNTGDEIGVYSSLNPQKNHGDDVISRIGYTIENQNGLHILKDMILEKINDMLDFFQSKHAIQSKNIYHINIVGNTVMTHLFAGLPVKAIASVPFNPVTTHLPRVKAEELGLKACPGAAVTSLPMIAGYIGADTVACILATDMIEDDDLCLMVDIGTNGEIALGNKDGLLACAAAAGPALEGAHIQCGLGGVQGAISKIEIGQDGIKYETIGGQPARGICGSGIVDAAAQMLKKGFVESYGRMLTAEEGKEAFPSGLANRIGEYNGKPSLTIATKEEGAAEDVFITQKDIREIQLAKAAIAAGIQILMQEMNVGFGDIKKVYLAGGFGNYINHDHAMEIGLLPAKLNGKIVPVGNAALTGSKMVVKSYGFMEAAEKIRSLTKYIELSTRLDFQEIFVDNMEF